MVRIEKPRYSKLTRMYLRRKCRKSVRMAFNRSLSCAIRCNNVGMMKLSGKVSSGI